jgi:alpha/beta superfamily hydrolase
MNSPVPLSIARCLSDHARERVAWARFDFRGVGASDGVYDNARGEVDDALAIIEELRRAAPGAPIAVCGHSFGSWVGLLAAARSPSVDRVLLIAPSVRFGAIDGPVPSPRLRKTIFIGDRDEFCDVDEARVLADDLGADLRVFEGFDHHFLKSRRALAEAALPIIAPEVVS